MPIWGRLPIYLPKVRYLPYLGKNVINEKGVAKPAGRLLTLHIYTISREAQSFDMDIKLEHLRIFPAPITCIDRSSTHPRDRKFDKRTRLYS